MQMINTLEAHLRTETADKHRDSAIASKSVIPSRKSSRKSILALSVFALAINGTAALYTMPSFNTTLPDISDLVAELLPHERAAAPKPEAGFPALVGIQY